MDRNQVAARLEKFEGRVPHMYRCTGGEVTVGIGHAIPGAAEAAQLQWEIAGQAASGIQAQADFGKVAAAPKGLLPSNYAAPTQCRLSDDNIQRLVNSDIQNFETRLSASFPKWNSYPEPVQEALFDMAFNLGIGGLKKFVKLLQAVDADDWETAAQESQRQGIGQARNVATPDLFRQAIGKAG
jgi:GH24 family phage-related lysozyme (muramidase)